MRILNLLAFFCEIRVLTKSNVCSGRRALRDLSHIAAEALVFGQAFAGRFNLWLFALGFIFVVVAYTVGQSLLKPINSHQSN